MSILKRGLTAASLTVLIAVAANVNISEAEAALGGPHYASVAYPAAPCIKYRSVGWRRICCDPCLPPLKAVLAAKDPCCCTACYLDIPVCLPPCCTDSPCVTSHRGLFGNGNVCYEWCCGFKVKITFKKCGDVLVTSYGRF